MAEEILNQPEPTNFSSQPDSHILKYALFILAGLLLLAGVVGGYWYGTKSTTPQPKTQTPETPTPEPTYPQPEEVDETDKMYQVVQTSTSPDGSYYITYSVLADHQKLTIKNKQGITVFDNLLDRITEDIWEGMQNLGLKGRGQVGYEISSWIDNSKFVLRILPANGEKYETIVNAKSGVIDKSSFRKIE